MNATDGADVTEGQEAWTLCVDVGCSHVAAVVTSAAGDPEPLEFDGRNIMPSGVWVDSQGRFVVGTAAMRQALLASQRWEPAPVRLLGDVDQHTLAGAPFEALDAVAEIFSHVQLVATEHLGRVPERTTLICPPGWSDARCDALAEAARRGGLDNIGILSSPVAAGSYLVGAQLLRVGATVALADVGAGSVSTAVVRRTEWGLDVLSWGWADYVGGNSLDLAILERVVRSVLSLQDPQVEAKLMQPADGRWRRLRETLLREVRRAREELTRYGTVRMHTDAVTDASIELTRHDLDLLIRPQIDDMVTQLQETIWSASIDADQLDGIALLGGAGATPLLARVVVAAMGQVPRLVPDPQLALAYGGATAAPAPALVPAWRGSVSAAPAPPAPPADGRGSDGPRIPPVIAPRVSDASPAGGLPAITLPPHDPPADPTHDDPQDDDPGDDAEPAPEPEPEALSEALSEAEVAAEPEAEPAVEPEPLTPPDPDPDPVADPDAVAVAVAEPEPLTPPDPEPVAEADPMALAEPEPLVPPDPDPDPEPEPVAEAEPLPLTPPDPEPEPVAEAEPVAVAEPELLTPPDSEPEPVAEVEPQRLTPPDPEPVAEAEPVAVAEPELLTPPDLEPVADPEPLTPPDPDLPTTGQIPVPDPATLRPPGPPRPAFRPPPPPARPVDTQPSSRAPRRPGVAVILLAFLVVALVAGGVAAVVRPNGDPDPSARPAVTVAPQPSVTVSTSQPSVTVGTPQPSAAASSGSSADDATWAAWKGDADLARVWSAVVPVDPDDAGSQGQECTSVDPDSPFSTHKILCVYPNGVRLTLLQYRTEADRDKREAQIAATPGVQQQDRDMRDLEGDLISGSLYEQRTEVWRWWVLDSEVHSAVYTRWPGHPASDLAQWWDQLAPFT